ncbi:metal-dependent hydrolase [Lachnospiraceae bacterium TWA4]|nr:metal-dependent hydrolase [Lachnospiraceae bacterium TWA4]
MTIEIEKEIDKMPDQFDFDWEAVIKEVILAAIDYEECPYEAEVSVTITNEEGIHQINKEFRDIDRSTDVLSFPMVNYEEPGNFDHVEDDEMECFNPETGELVLGDIVLCVEKILEQAENYNHSVKRELAFLTAHSMFHLFGYDHMEDDERIVMEKRQSDLLEQLGISR